MAFKLFGKKEPKGLRRKDERDFLLLSANSPFHFQEAFNSLRTNLNFVSVSNSYKKIILTSSIPSEGKSSIAINLGVSIATTGSSVLIIDCDMRKPVLHRYLRLKNVRKGGLSSALSGKGSVSENIVKFKDIGLSLMPSGPIPPNPVELLGSEKMKELIEELEQSYDYIIFDTAPVSVVTDAAVLSQFADGVILVVRQQVVTIEQAQKAKKNLESVNANILGVVLNDFDINAVDMERGHYYNYYYDYSSGKE